MKSIVWKFPSPRLNLSTNGNEASHFLSVDIIRYKLQYIYLDLQGRFPFWKSQNEGDTFYPHPLYFTNPGNTKGGSIIVPLTSCLTGFANKNKNCQLSYSWFQTSQTGGQHHSDTSPFSIPWPIFQFQAPVRNWWRRAQCWGRRLQLRPKPQWRLRWPGVNFTNILRA